MDVLNVLDTGYGYFSKGLELIRNAILWLAAFLPLEERLALAIICLIVSIYLAYVIMSKLTTHPFSTSHLAYLAILAWLIFSLLFYFQI